MKQGEDRNKGNQGGLKDEVNFQVIFVCGERRDVRYVGVSV